MNDKPDVDKIALYAKKRGWIILPELCFILAEKPEYDVNTRLKSLGVDPRFLPKQKNQTPYRERVGKWSYILHAMVQNGQIARTIQIHIPSKTGSPDAAFAQTAFELSRLKALCQATLKINLPDRLIEAVEDDEEKRVSQRPQIKIRRHCVGKRRPRLSSKMQRAQDKARDKSFERQDTIHALKIFSRVVNINSDPVRLLCPFFSTRTRNCLLNKRVDLEMAVAEFMEMGAQELLKTKNFGPMCFFEIITILELLNKR